MKRIRRWACSMLILLTCSCMLSACGEGQEGPADGETPREATVPLDPAPLRSGGGEPVREAARIPEFLGVYVESGGDFRELKKNSEESPLRVIPPWRLVAHGTRQVASLRRNSVVLRRRCNRDIRGVLPKSLAAQPGRVASLTVREVHGWIDTPIRIREKPLRPDETVVAGVPVTSEDGLYFVTGLGAYLQVGDAPHHAFDRYEDGGTVVWADPVVLDKAISALHAKMLALLEDGDWRAAQLEIPVAARLPNHPKSLPAMEKIAALAFQVSSSQESHAAVRYRLATQLAEAIKRSGTAPWSRQAAALARQVVEETVPDLREHLPSFTKLFTVPEDNCYAGFQDGATLTLANFAYIQNWSLSTGEHLRTVSLKRRTGGTAMAFREDGRLLLVTNLGNSGGHVTIHDARTGDRVGHLDETFLNSKWKELGQKSPTIRPSDCGVALAQFVGLDHVLIVIHKEYDLSSQYGYMLTTAPELKPVWTKWVTMRPSAVSVARDLKTVAVGDHRAGIRAIGPETEGIVVLHPRTRTALKQIVPNGGTEPLVLAGDSLLRWSSTNQAWAVEAELASDDVQRVWPIGGGDWLVGQSYSRGFSGERIALICCKRVSGRYPAVAALGLTRRIREPAVSRGATRLVLLDHESTRGAHVFGFAPLAESVDLAGRLRTVVSPYRGSPIPGTLSTRKDGGWRNDRIELVLDEPIQGHGLLKFIEDGLRIRVRHSVDDEGRLRIHEQSLAPGSPQRPWYRVGRQFALVLRNRGALANGRGISGRTWGDFDGWMTLHLTRNHSAPRIDAQQLDTARSVLTGKWTGTYTASQGPTGCTLAISSVDERLNVAGSFSFYNLSGKENAKEGAFRFTGQFQAETKRLVTTPGDWIARPEGWGSLSVDASVDLVKGLITGVVRSGNVEMGKIEVRRGP